ncbi:MAG: YlmC/YmxH family sporulation protein [Clostridia bacterium]|nr:YlmC/YmxH family sporulation protein [Clostridia bacterium]
MHKAADFRQKEVINIKTGQRMGYISDVDIDMNNGSLNSIIIPGGSKFLGVFGKEEDIIIPWNAIRTIGDEVILVDYDALPVRRQAK